MARNIDNLTAAELISDYAEKFMSRTVAIESTALRTEAHGYRSILTHQATSGNLNFPQLRALLLHGRVDLVEKEVTNASRLGSLGRILLLQEDNEDDHSVALHCLELAAKLTPPNGASRRLRRLLIEDRILAGEATYVHSMLDEYSDLDREYFGYLRAETQNPFRNHVKHESALNWLESFNQPFIKNELSPVRLSNTGGTPFDRLRTGTPAEEALFYSVPRDGVPTVSVILTTFQPDREALITSVTSVLDQTWEDLELLIVDDASGEAYQDTIEEAAALDSRIRLITCEENGGTYVARNIGYENARGEFVTGQDDDDWSHPQRIQLQVEALQESPSAPACRARAISCDEDLSRVRRGYKPEGPNASSLMVRRSVFDAVGGFLPIRKAADTELAKRIEAVTMQPILDVDKPLAIIRILEDSLSRSHFRTGWQHPSRRQFKSSYEYWHRSAKKSELCLRPNQVPRVAIPRALRGDQQSFPDQVDVVFAGDWRQFGGPQKSMLEEINALNNAGYSVGILHLEAGRFISTLTKPMCDPIQRLVNEGAVHEVVYDDRVNVQLLILRYPPILQFPPAHQSALKVEQLIVLANQAPSERDGSDIRYLVPDCHDNARAMFGQFPLWVPQGPQVRDAIRSYLDTDSLAEFDMPGIVAPDDWVTDRESRRSLVPVVGRHSRDNPMKWPDSSETLKTVYPTDGRYDVRILGGAEVALGVMGRASSPSGWTVYSTNEISALSFLQSLDYYVFYQHEQSIEAFGRAILEALATGLVVILPERFRRVFGDGAIYRSPQDVELTIREFQEDPALYHEQSNRALKTVRDKFSHKAYKHLISQLFLELSGQDKDTVAHSNTSQLTAVDS